MRSFAEQKVSGGKLVGVRLEYGGRIEKIEILGDFFLYPEESLQRIERALVGMSKDSKKEELVDRISWVVSEEKAELIGITPEAIADTIIMAVRK